MRRLVIIFSFFVFLRAAGQPVDSTLTGSSLVQDSLVNIYYAYQQHENLSLYNGRQFYGYPPAIEGHAFYRSDQWSQGAVLYDGLWYRDVMLMYDIYRDELIVRHPTQVHIILFSPRVQQFVIEGQTFVYLQEGKTGNIKSGFYQQLVSGKATVYVKRAKQLDEKIDGLVLERKFITANQFFIRKENTFHPVRKQQDLMRLLYEKRQELSRFKSQEELKFKGNAEQFIVRLSERFNQL